MTFSFQVSEVVLIKTNFRKPTAPTPPCPIFVSDLLGENFIWNYVARPLYLTQYVRVPVLFKKKKKITERPDAATSDNSKLR